MIEKNEFFFTNDDYEVFDPELVTSTDIKINQQRNIKKSAKRHSEVPRSTILTIKE